jgi:hypothetical protein
MKKFVDGVQAPRAVDSCPYSFSLASIDLIGSPCVDGAVHWSRPTCTRPGVPLTVRDTVPALTSYRSPLNTTNATLAGEINEAYAYIKNGVLMLYAGKKIGDLTLTGVSQEQGRSSDHWLHGRGAASNLSAPISVTPKHQSNSKQLGKQAPLRSLRCE